MWGIITVQMLNLGFPFKPADMFTLTAIAGLMGATMRIPASFFIRLSGGRNTIFLTSALLIIPAVWTGIALQDKNTPLWVFQAWRSCRASAAATLPARCPTSAASFPSACRAPDWA
jgi:NNP family nitrate/nitrite transporter-like MFS transporter